MKGFHVSQVSRFPVAKSTVITARVTEFIDKYQHCLKKTTAQILELADVVATAKRELNVDEYTCFRNESGFDKSKDSFLKKLLCIAGKAGRLNDLSDKLPPNYTTLYSLSKLSDESFKEVCADNVIHPRMTAADLSGYLKKNKAQSENYRVTLNLKNLSASSQRKALNELEAFCKKFKIELKTTIQLPTMGSFKAIDALKQTDVEDGVLVYETEPA
jgi:hypothetical protein